MHGTLTDTRLFVLLNAAAVALSALAVGILSLAPTLY